MARSSTEVSAAEFTKALEHIRGRAELSPNQLVSLHKAGIITAGEVRQRLGLPPQQPSPPPSPADPTPIRRIRVSRRATAVYYFILVLRFVYPIFVFCFYVLTAVLLLTLTSSGKRRH